MTRSRWSITAYDVLGSTMDEAALLAQRGAPSGTVVVARHQTAGRGRAGRSWIAPPDAALQMTALLRVERPPRSLGVLPLLVGVAVARAIETLAPGLTCTLKWPNDVLISGRKVGGILLTSKVQGDQTTLLIGIGVNVLGEHDALPEGATSVAAEAGLAAAIGPGDLLPLVLDELGAVYDRFRRGDWDGDLDEWRSRASFLNERVQIADAGRTLTGTFVGVDWGGALLLRLADGSIQRIVAGDLTRGPRVGA